MIAGISHGGLVQEEMFDSFFDYISEQVNFPVDKVRYVTLFFLSFPLASFLRVVLHYSYTSTTTRHTVSIILGLFFGWLCFKWQVLYLIGFVLVGYILLVTLPPSVVQRYSVAFAIFGISTGHIYRLYTDYGGYTLDFTGPLMLLVQRVSYVAYAYHDGVARPEKDLSEDQKRLKISVIPSLLEYFSYNFCFLTFLAGPSVAYKEYDDFITGRNITEAKNKQSSTEPSPLIPTLKIFLGSMIAMSIVIIGGSWTDTSLVLDPELHLLRRIINVWFFCLAIRSQYYFTFLMTESICNAGGLGFSGYDNEGKAVWDNAKNIDFKNFEFGVNPREVTMAWNIKTVYWVRRVFYDRGWGVLGSNIASAVWHGFYPGYYILFVFIAFGSINGRKLRRLLWHRFQSPRYVKILYDTLSTSGTAVFRDFCQAAFWLLTVENVYIYCKHFYFAPPLILILLAVLLPEKKREKKTE